MKVVSRERSLPAQPQPTPAGAGTSLYMIVDYRLPLTQKVVIPTILDSTPVSTCMTPSGSSCVVFHPLASKPVFSRVLLSRYDTKPMLHLKSYYRPCLRVIVSAVVVQ